ncbi:MAG: adenylosuccinate synthase, partial [Acetobacteraceae bacterium]|nr:adenylosuccinate synthase [Acetobacteraceae bacterium]
GRLISVYVGDQANTPIPSARVGGKATVLIGGKSQQVMLVPAAANSLTGRLDPGATGKVTAVLALTINDKPSQVRFTLTQP